MEKISLPLPIYTSIPAGVVAAKDGEEFDMVVGLSRELVDELIQKSLDETDEEIQKNTSDRQRFGSRESFEEWYKKERTIFALVQKGTGALATIGWFGPKPLGRKSLRHLSASELAEEGNQKKDDWHTIVYRAYPPFRGKGIMKGFLLKAIELYEQGYPNAKIWAGIALDNAPSIGLAEKLGFKKVDSLVDTEGNWLAMVKER